ncbi:MAG: hypothetical protein CVU64_02945 [Deltaproteobacteria bacterium HGW-Deltaproteobacteria-21]|nr:MAG: hypothetical protein CVU64_02945 [Deltaproteobacteria bacterium HGW-Deltaproteobacteria-21]
MISCSSPFKTVVYHLPWKWQSLGVPSRKIIFTAFPHRMQDARYRIQDPGCKMQDPGAAEMEKGPPGMMAFIRRSKLHPLRGGPKPSPPEPDLYICFSFDVGRWMFDVYPPMAAPKATRVRRSSSSHFPASCILDPICSCILKLVDLPN